ncbi:hypothetical protein IE4872_PD00065 (plasmid) [Rhizobium gallicum]|uniref:Uncharacterized protein n=1 Tax=Rhizobium gallicum TaxID=56730 RepID=A0A1L5NRV5_9HYPH|nr:hypothetical protein IE4872_PD00065 [Rhizobium gallicum]
MKAPFSMSGTMSNWEIGSLPMPGHQYMSMPHAWIIRNRRNARITSLLPDMTPIKVDAL